MNKDEKTLLIGGLAVGGILLVAYMARRPASSTYRPVYLPNTAANQLTTDISVASGAASGLEGLVSNLFGSSNSGSSSGSGGTSTIMYDPTDETISGVERAGAIH